MPITFLQRFTVISLMLLLGACASLKPQDTQDILQKQLSDLTVWQVRGKLSVLSPYESNTGYLTWKQNKNSYDVFLAGPFGAGASRLYGNLTSANLLLPGWDKPQTAPSAEVLTEIYLGWYFPVSDIRYWLKGQPSPISTAELEFNDHGLLQSLKQDGWEVRYSRYHNRKGYWLPGLIRISGFDHRFTFAIQEWSFNG